MKILIVEDKIEGREILRYYLEDRGWDVLEAADGEEGLATAVRELPDVIVSDILMEKMDGYELLREIRRHDAVRETPFIFYTGVYTTPSEAKLARDLGVNAFIVKPQDAEAFCNHINMVIENLEPRPGKAATELLEKDDEFLRKYSQVVTSQLKRQIRTLETTQEEIRKGEVNYRNLFNSIRDVIIIADLDRVILDANQPALREVFGYETEELVGQSTSLIYASREGYESIGRVFFDNADTEYWQVVELDFRRKSGEEFRAEFYPLKMTDNRGNVVANIGMIRDISKRKLIEEMLHHVFESMGEGMAVVDRDYRILAANKAYCDLFRVSMADVVGQSCYEVSHKINRPCHQNGRECPARLAFDTGEMHTVVHQHRDDRGRTRYHENRGYPLKDKQGRIRSVIEVYNDITERTQLEEQLRHVQKMEAIGTLTGGIAHDFNNILSVIVGHGTLMQMKLEPGHPFRESVDNIMHAAERATSLTQRLLTFSRKQVMDFEPVILCDIVSNLENLLKKLTREDIELKMALTDIPLVVEADRGQLEQVLMNLVINASQAITYDGRIDVVVRKGEIDEAFVQRKGFGKAGTYAVLTVRDNGCGMDDETLSKIYEPFFTTKEVGVGTGLGLSVVYGIVKQHHGFIDCTSTPAFGTTFDIYLPISDTVDVITRQEPPAIVPTDINETILVAEDDDNVRFLLKDLLEEAGYQVVVAENGVEAIRLFTERRRQVDLVLLDVIMPLLNGKETLDEIRKLNRRVKAIFISGYTDDILQQKGFEDDRVPFLHKPIAPNVLLGKVRSVLDQ